MHFVDLPGYGFAQRSKAERERWADLIFDFLDMERSFNLVVSLVDIRHDPSKLDHQMIEFLQEGGYPFVVALTKADKLSRSQQGRQLATIRKQLSVPAEDIIVTSRRPGSASTSSSAGSKPPAWSRRTRNPPRTGRAPRIPTGFPHRPARIPHSIPAGVDAGSARLASGRTLST